MNNLYFTLILLCGMTMSFQNSQANSNATKGDSSSLYYVVKEPPLESEKMPVLILLHGIGSNEEDLFSFAQQLHPQLLIVSVRAPYPVDKRAYAWYQIDYSSGEKKINEEQAENSRQLLIQFLHQLFKKYPIDTEKVYLMGFSQGSIMSYTLALTQPGLIRGVLALSGRILEEAKPRMAKGGDFKNLSVFIGHGVQDHVIPIEEGRIAAKFCQELQIPVTYKEYNMRHEISSDELEDVNTWLVKMLKSK